jgi:hypothetical protein
MKHLLSIFQSSDFPISQFPNLLIFIMIFFSSCQKLDDFLSQSDAKKISLSPGLTPHFNQWLINNGYDAFDFAQYSLYGGSYGGKQNDNDAIIHDPVIFIHGNSDKALGNVFGQSGWTNSIKYFLSNGYTQAELYAITWGPANAAQSTNQYHSKEYIERIRTFIDAVLAYTGVSKVDIISHSMGVTLSRKAIKGGNAYDNEEGGNYSLGGALSDSIDTFVGIAGANYGLVNCALSNAAACDKKNGFFPGYSSSDYSDILEDLNSSTHYEGSYVYSIWSVVDEVIGYGCIVYGRNTCQIPGQDGEKYYFSAPYGHFNVKDLTAKYQLNMVKNHAIK